MHMWVPQKPFVPPGPEWVLLIRGEDQWRNPCVWPLLRHLLTDRFGAFSEKEVQLHVHGLLVKGVLQRCLKFSSYLSYVYRIRVALTRKSVDLKLAYVSSLGAV